MKKTKKMLSFVLSMLLIVTMFPTMAFAKEEAKTWKFGELSLKAGDVLGKDTEIKNDAENREIRILSEKTNPDEKKDQKDDKERIKTEKEAVIAAAASWNLKDLTEKAKKAPADYLLKKADSWNGSWIVTKIAETETKDAIEIQVRTYEYAAVTEIQGIPKEIPGTTALTGKAVPECRSETDHMGNHGCRNDRCCFRRHKPESNECRNRKTSGDNQRRKENRR
mgnify:CR=1 FL=1